MLPRNRWLVLTIVSSALIVIDMTALYTALPRLTRDLSATATENLWIVNAYPLVVAGLLLGLGGWATGESSCRVWSGSGPHRRRRPSLRHPAP
ncbi:MAG: hypothetical protein ACK41Y_07095 [Paracoccus hibiscisoli]|uniref:hypothetical protein n=1 Tax=Paracoccus hibiscisoli TaxID=2023261 RepID=UPI00391BA4AA